MPRNTAWLYCNGLAHIEASIVAILDDAAGPWASKSALGHLFDSHWSTAEKIDRAAPWVNIGALVLLTSRFFRVYWRAEGRVVEVGPNITEDKTELE